jgi:hypothetical protein
MKLLGMPIDSHAPHDKSTHKWQCNHETVEGGLLYEASYELE